MAAPKGKYRGRLVADGNGNLLADEGEHKGKPVAYSEENGGAFVFVQKGEKSHNERHHKGELHEIYMTQHVDPDLPGYAGAQSDPLPGYEHHFGTDEPVRHDPDEVARTATGHTDAWGDENE